MLHTWQGEKTGGLDDCHLCRINDRKGWGQPGLGRHDKQAQMQETRN